MEIGISNHKDSQGCPKTYTTGLQGPDEKIIPVFIGQKTIIRVS